MAKAITLGKKKSEQVDQQKARKKDAKKEAKLVYQVDQAKKDVRKAEQKAAKAQTTLQDLQAHLQKLEEELTQFRHAGQSTTEVHTDTTQNTQSTAPDDLQTSSSLPAEGRNDIDASWAANAEADTTVEVDYIEVQPSSPPIEGRSDIAQDEATGPETANTPIESIPTEQSNETTGAQVHADISINPAPAEEGLTINSGDGSIPVVTSNENAWPPPQIREELAESIAQDAAQEPSKATYNVQDAAEENLAITSGDGSIPVVTSNENAWPPPQIREELAESIVEEVAQEHAAGNNGHSEANESDVEEETENHDSEHETSASRPRRSTRRRTRSSAEQNTNKADQE